MNKSKKSQVGKIGEDIAAEYLIRQGYKIVDRNFRKPWGEIDIIAVDNLGILIFFEVKTIAGSTMKILPEDNMTQAKMSKLARTCYIYANQNEKLIGDGGWR